jgi:hypothetical protein
MISVKITKPLYETEEGSVVRVRDKYINQAIKYNERIRITTYWRGQEIYQDFNPRQIKLLCKKIEQIFLRPEEPMILYEILVGKPKSISQEEYSLEMVKKGFI